MWERVTVKYSYVGFHRYYIHPFYVQLQYNVSLVPRLLPLRAPTARGTEWEIYFSLYTYVRTYRNMSCSGVLIGMLQVSCRPIEFYLPQGLDGTRSTALRLRSVDEHAVPPMACRAGAATYGDKQSAQSTSATP